MKSYKNLTYTLLAAFLVSFGIVGCSSVSNDSAEELISEADLEAASQIIGETLSSENSGAMSSVYDALSDVGVQGITYNDRRAKEGGVENDRHGNAGRGAETNFSYSYDPETGTHTVDFERNVTRTDTAGNEHNKGTSAHLEYIFTDLEGEFIALPRWRNRAIETIDYKGTKSGYYNGPNVTESTFSRTDTLLFTGVHGSSPVFGLNGSHNGEGNFDGVLKDGTPVQKEYEVEVDFENVEIDKAVVLEKGNLEGAVSGVLTYTVTYTNEDGELETVEGTIILEEQNEYALVRFNGFSKVFRMSLRDGHDRDRDGSNETRNGSTENS